MSSSVFWRVDPIENRFDETSLSRGHNSLIRVEHMQTHLQRAIVFITALLLLQACAGLKKPEKPLVSERPAAAQDFFERLDAVVDEYGVNDASSFPVRGFPYLRTNRFLVAMEGRLTDDARKELWIQWMRELGTKTQAKEIQNLPAAALRLLGAEGTGNGDRQELLDTMAGYSRQMVEADQKRSDFFESVAKAAKAPDEYSTPMRIFGLYAVVAVPVALVTHRAYGKYERWHRTQPEQLPVEGSLVRVAPERPVAPFDAGIGRLFASSRLNAFGLPSLSDADAELLARAFAPILTQDVVADYDRFGRVSWQDGRVRIDPSAPTVYYYISHSLADGEPVTQINYALWYSERSGEKSPGIERGPLDGVTFRLSLDRSGRPLMADVMNNCGCYFFYIPHKNIVSVVRTSPDKLYPFVPAWLPETFPEKRVELRINSGWHQVERITTEKTGGGDLHYTLVPYRVLESLPRPDGNRESVFTPDGIMKDSYRIEPYIFFSMGIPKVGYMRQRSHHAIKLVGRGHFTDTDIYDRYFDFR
jgi:hypothetical protein